MTLLWVVLLLVELLAHASSDRTGFIPKDTCTPSLVSSSIPVCPDDVIADTSMPIYTLQNDEVAIGWFPSRRHQKECSTGGTVTSYCTALRSTQAACDINCAAKQTGNLSCSGDHDWCQGKACKDRKVSSCHCGFKRTTIEKQIRSGTSWLQYKHSNFTKISRSSRHQSSNGNHLHSMRTLSSEDRSMEEPIPEKPCIISIESNVVTSSCQVSCTLVMKKGGWIGVAFVSGGRTLYTIPDDNMKTSEYLSLEFTADGRLVQTEKRWIVGTTLCQSDDCLMCWNAFDAMSCQPSSRRAFLYLVLMVAASVATFSMWISLSYCWVFVAGFVNLVICCRAVSRCCKRQAEKGWARTRAKVQELHEPDDEEAKTPIRQVEPPSPEHSIIMEESRAPVVTSRRAPPIGYFGVVFILSMMLGSVQAEFGSSVLATSGERCEVVGNLKTCKLVSSMTMAMTGGSSSNFVSFFNAAGEPLASYQFSFETFWASIQTSTAYYTSAWEAISNSKHNCYNVGRCDDNNCANTKKDDPTANGNFGGEISSLPGESNCRPSCQCAGCGCFYCVSSCVFERYAIRPAQPFEVRQISGNAILKAKVKVTMTDSNGFVPILEELMDAGDELSVSGLTINLAAIASNFATPFSTQGLVISQYQEASIREISQPNAPQQGICGEIQANSAESLLYPTVDSFIFASDMVSASYDEHYTTYQAKTSAMEEEPLHTLPAVVEGSLFTFEEGGLKARVTQGSIIMNINAPDGLVFVKKNDRVCPEFSINEIGGCSSCSSGIAIAIIASSTCFSGTVKVTLDSTRASVLNPIHFLSTDKQSLIIYLSSSIVNNKYKLIMNSGSDTFSADLDFIAPSEGLIKNDTYVNVNVAGVVISNDETSFFDKIADFFVGIYDTLFGWSYWNILIIIVVSTCFVFFVGFLYYRYKKANEMRKMMKVK